MKKTDPVTVDILPEGEQHTFDDHCPVSRPEWRAAWDRIRCPVVREFFSHFVGPMTHAQVTRFRSICLTIEVPKGTREEQWRRSVFLADIAIRRIAPEGLERCGRADLAAELRGWLPLRTWMDFHVADRRFSRGEHERISSAARSAMTYASRLGDGGGVAKRCVADRVLGGTAAGSAMQIARAWCRGAQVPETRRRLLRPASDRSRD